MALALVALLLNAAPASAQAQQPLPSSDVPMVLTIGLTAQTLADLPLGDNLYTALETMQAEIISDRFNSGGLNVGEGARVGGFLASWSQTLFRIGDVDISDPSGSGAPLLFPELLPWQRAEIANGLMPADLNAPGLGITLEPRRPGATWTTIVEAGGSGGSMAGSAPEDSPPPIVRLDNATHASVVLSGPIRANRLGLAAGGNWGRASRFSRQPIDAADSDLGSAFVNLVYTPSSTTEWRTLAWAQGARVPFEYRHLTQPDATTEDLSVHVQSTWDRRSANGMGWRLFGGLTHRGRTSPIGSSSALVAERLLDGPIPTIADATGDRSTQRWTLGTRATIIAPRGAQKHVMKLGVDVDGARARTSDQFVGVIGELVDGAPARAWSFSHPGMDSKRHSLGVAAVVSDRITLNPALVLDAALRFEAVSGRADGSATPVTWFTWLPQAFLRWEFAETRRIALVTGYRRAANRLNLDLLAYGDPAAATAVVTRWPSTVPQPPAAGGGSVIIDRVGPGTGGDPSFSSIDSSLDRPITDEFVVGVDSQGRGWLQMGLIGVARRETNLINVVDVGVPLSSYSTVFVEDPALLLLDPGDDQSLPVYNRLPSSYGRNQYVLTNPGQEAATAFALEFTARSSIDRLFLLFGATASAANGSSGNRGYRAIENDQDVVGELFTNPNATTHDRGRLFSDRAFTIKWSTVYRFPHDFRVGAIARYQDGQPFSRLVLAPDLNQGAELVRAYGNGGNRFTFTGTLDIRFQKGFRTRAGQIDAILDFYNLATRSNEVEEYPVTGPEFRTPTAIEPPHSIHLGVRVTF